MAAPDRLSRAESQARTREALLGAAAAVFVERGLHRASVEAIAERAGFTRGAFYSNFASKQELFAELLQSRVYTAYRRMIDAQLASDEPLPSSRESAEGIARVQDHPDGRWMFRLWLEVLLEAAEAGRELPTAPTTLASALIALDIGLAIQHYVDPDVVPLDLYPEVFGTLFDEPPG